MSTAPLEFTRLYGTLGHITIIRINKERIANIIPEAALSYIQTDAYVMLSKVRYINIYMVPHICLPNGGSVRAENMEM